jgi:hypothetical protein
MKLPVIEKRYIPWGVGALVLIAVFASLAKGSTSTSGGRKYSDRYEAGPTVGPLSTWGDTETGDIYGWIAGDNGEYRFVRYDKVSESKARAALNGEPEVKIVYKEAPSAKVETQSDVRSGRIFERSAPYKSGSDLYNINARIKYREKENRMLYRFAVSIAPEIVNGKPKECVTAAQVKRLKAIASTPGSSAQMRFEDSDKFWVKDISVPLAGAAANNKVTSVTDSEKDKCGNINTLVFHNRADMTLPDFSWIENGKLLFNGVKFQPGPAAAPKPQKKA